MSDHPLHRPRNVAIPDHLWEAIEEMSRQMGTERDGLICQALFMFARLNGFLDGRGASRTPTGRSPAPQVSESASTGSSPELREVSGSAEPTGPMPTTAATLGSSPAEPSPGDGLAPSPPSDEDGDQSRGQLYVLTESGTLDRVVKDRFVIGRGKHCDFVIPSGKVSREHAVVVREDASWFIEDLGSSNGTWFNKQRVKRRQVEDGDEYYICNEKIKFVLR
ncbi:MAG TPA: FHA domain-containing protein [Myxococcaceae bacterium]|nr:FHA domain-containing protein [Myxococcaceae bacterium]